MKRKIFDHAIKRIAEVFDVPKNNLKLEHRFDVELQASFVSDFRDNEYDQINSDIQDVADKQTLKQLQSGDLTISTVEDYCVYMFRSFERKTKDVRKVLGLTSGPY